jgi:protease-4
MIRLIKLILMTLGAGVIAAAVAAWFWMNQHMPKMPTMPEHAVIEIDLTKRVVDYGQVNLPLRWLGGQVIVFHEALEAIYRAAEDPRVKGVVMLLGNHDLGLAQVQEIRAAIHYLRQRGKFAYAHAETLEEGGSGTRAYYLATACDLISVQPMGGVGLVGVQVEVPFAKKTLEKLGVMPQFEKLEDYKTAPNTFTEEGFTPTHRESLQGLLEDVHRQIMTGIAQDRKLTRETVEALCHKGPFTAQEALTHKLIDRLAYLDEVRDIARERAGKSADIVPYWLYNHLGKQIKIALKPAAKIAVIHASGTIQSGDVEQRGISPRMIAKAFKEIRADKLVRAVVVRIDSGGGSATASETIWREIICCQRAGIPVIVSMANYAASGGYLISVPANYIFAESATITGSIGVYSGKMVLKGVWDHIGLQWGTLATADNAGMFSANSEFSPYGRERLRDMVESTYQLFLQKVAEGRELPLDQVKAVAGGRVWTGDQALNHRLVDEIGGLVEAINHAKKQIAGVMPVDVIVDHYPRPKSISEQLMMIFGYLEPDEDDIGGILLQLYYAYNSLRTWGDTIAAPDHQSRLKAVPIRLS